MGNCEIVDRQASLAPEAGGFSPVKSIADDKANFDESFDEKNRIGTMRSFNCQSLAGLKIAANKNMSKGQSNDRLDETEVLPPTLMTTNSKQIVLRGNTLALLKDVKIDPRIFINVKKGQVTEDYSIESLLGEGTYGKVLLVTYKKTGFKRALKSNLDC